MAQYTIITTRKQEIGLKFSYDMYADKALTQEQYFQQKINEQVTNPMYLQEQQSHIIAFDQSFNTIPEPNQPKAQTEIEAVIISNGGEIVQPTPPGPIPPPGPPSSTSFIGGTLSTPGGEGSNNIQTGAADKGILPSSRPDGGGD